MTEPPVEPPYEQGRYTIRLQGHLDARWASTFHGMTLIADEDGTTVLEGPVEDQAALHGLLRTLRDLGVPLVSLTPSHAARPAANSPHSTRSGE